MNYKYKIGFLGCGNMAKAIAEGIINKKILSSQDMIMSSLSHIGNFEGIKVVSDNTEILNDCEYVILAIKPQVFTSIADSLSQINAKYVISIMAGITSAKISKILNNRAEIIRVMPNTPCSVGEGMSVVASNKCSEVANKFTLAIFNSVGKTETIDESLFDAMTSVSGSGPAYVYYFLNSLIKGGVAGGLKPETARKLAIQTFVGACKLADSSTSELEVLIEKVCSKGGTTIQAIESFKNDEIETKIIDGVLKCKLRSEELGK